MPQPFDGGDYILPLLNQGYPIYDNLSGMLVLPGGSNSVEMLLVSGATCANYTDHFLLFYTRIYPFQHLQHPKVLMQIYYLNHFSRSLPSSLFNNQVKYGS